MDPVNEARDGSIPGPEGDEAAVLDLFYMLIAVASFLALWLFTKASEKL